MFSSKQDKLKIEPTPFYDWRRIFALFLLLFVLALLVYWWQWLPALDNLETRGRERAISEQDQRLNEERLSDVMITISTRAEKFESYLNQ